MISVCDAKIGTIWDIEPPMIMTKEGWIELAKVEKRNLSNLGLSGVVISGIDKDGNSLAGQKWPDYVTEALRRFL